LIAVQVSAQGGGGRMSPGIGGPRQGSQRSGPALLASGQVVGTAQQ